MPLVPSNDPAAKNGMVRSHRFPGANTALPFVNHDAVQLKVVQDFLERRPDLGGRVRRHAIAAAGVAETAAGLGRRRGADAVEHVRGR